MRDLFDDAWRYPRSPGYKRPDSVSELYALGAITKSEERRVNDGGLTAAVWVAVKGRSAPPPKRRAKERT